MKMMQANNELKKLRNRALYYLAKREYGYQELIEKIKPYSSELNLDNDSLHQVVNELKDKNLQSDKRFCESYINSKKNKFGAKRISYELSKKKIEQSLIDSMIFDVQTNEYIFAQTVWEKKYNAIADNVGEKTKQIRFMQSRGFSFEIIKMIIK